MFLIFSAKQIVGKNLGRSIVILVHLVIFESVYMEEFGQSCTFGSSAVYDGLHWFIWVKHNHIVCWLERWICEIIEKRKRLSKSSWKTGGEKEMYLKMLNWWNLFVDIKMKNMPDCIRCSNVMPVYVIFYLISSILYCCSVWTFINILEAIIDSSEHSDRLDINMGLEFCQQKRIVSHC